MTAHDAISRRALFRGQFADRPEDRDRWHPIAGIGAGRGDVLWDGWADEAGVFVVGDDGAIFHFDGDEWSSAPSPVQAPIHALWGNDRASLWAVGWMGLVLRHDGETWTRLRGCVVDAGGKYSGDLENTPLFDIDGRPDGRAWAVGDRGTILSYDGATWHREPSGTRAHLRAVLCLGDGGVLAAGGDSSVLLRDEAGDWRPLVCPVASNFTSAVELDKGAVLLSGGRYIVDTNGFRGDLAIWENGRFDRLFDGASFSRFRDLARTPDGVATVGDAGQIHILRDGGIDRIDSGTTHDLLGLVMLPGEEALVVGDFGVVLIGNRTALGRFAPSIGSPETGSRWRPMESGTDRQLWGLWQDPATSVLHACGEEGTVLILDRGQWERLPPVGALGVHALARASDGSLLAAGQLGEIHRFDGGSWIKLFDLHMDVTILDMWTDGCGTVFAVGDEGLILRDDGSGWERMTSGTRSALYGVWGIDAAHVLAVGDFGLVLRWNGVNWEAFNAGTEHFLFDVWGRGLSDVHVVGLSGTIGHFDGTQWRIAPARARNDLLAMTGDRSSVLAVGAGGVAVLNNGSRWVLDPTGTTAGLRAIAAGAEGTFFAAGDGGTIRMRLVDPVEQSA